MKNLIWIFALLLIVFVGDRFGGYFLRKIVEKSQFRYSRAYLRRDTADILLLGNSRGLTFFQPEIESVTGRSTLNLSYNAMPMDLAEVLVKDYLDSHIAPKVLVIDVTMLDRQNAEMIAGFNCYTPYSTRLDSLIRKYDKTVAYGGKFSQLYRYNSEIFQRAVFYRNRSDADWLLDRVIAPSMAADTAPKSYRVRLDSAMLAPFARTVAYAQSKGVDVQLVISPYFPNFERTIRDSFLTPVIAATEAASRLKVHDYSRTLTATEAFGDYQHANKKGCIKYINQLGLDGIFNAANAAVNASISETPLSPTPNTINNISPAQVVQVTNTVVETPPAAPTMSVDTAQKKPHRRRARSQHWESVDTVGLWQIQRK